MTRWPRGLGEERPISLPLAGGEVVRRSRSVTSMIGRRRIGATRHEKERSGFSETTYRGRGDRYGALHEVREPRPERRLDELDVGEEPRKEVPGRRARVEAGGLAEQLRVRVAAEVPHHREADPVERELGEVGKDVLRGEREEEQERDREPRGQARGLGRADGRSVDRVEPAQERSGPLPRSAAEPGDRRCPPAPSRRR